MGEMILITGGARSGKSRFAEKLASERGPDVLYLATLEPGDEEMARRVQVHRASRPAVWRTLEEPLDVTGALEKSGPYGVCLLDCLTLWVSNLLLTSETEDSGEACLERVRRLVLWQGGQAAGLIVVTNEVGSGLVPEYPLGRLFRDILGEANQLMAAAADAAYLCVAGYAIDIKAGGRPIR